MTMVRRICLSSAVVIATLTMANAEKKPAPAVAKGVPFYLPKTILNVDLTVSKTVKKNGQFCRFNDLFLGADKICAGQPESETVVKSFAVTPVGAPDLAHAYFIPATEKGGWAIDTSGSLDLTERGLLTSVDSGRVNRRFEVIVSALQAVAGVSKAIFFNALAPPPPPPPAEPTSGKEKAPGSEDSQAFIHEFLKDDWMLVWNFHKVMDAKPDRASALVTLWKRSDPALLAARQAYAGIEKLNTAYERLLGGEGAAGAATLVVEVRKEIDDRRKRYFAGTSDSATWSPKFEVDPIEGDLPLIQIGSCGAKAVSGVKVISNADPGDVKCDDASNPISLTLNKMAAPIADIGKIDACLNQGIMIGIPFTQPAEAAATLKGLEGPVSGIALQIAQWGGQSCLPVPGGSFTASVTYWESTGAIKTAKFTTNSSLTKDSTSALGGIATDLVKADIDARQKAADDAKNKDLADLQAERQRLEERVKIQAACAALNITCQF
jgi:Domain of unknown function (DUF4831)